MATRLIALIVAITSLSSAPAPAELRVQRPAVSETWVRTELHFGMQRPGGEITDAQFGEFINREIAPRFPEGFTLVTGYGHFQSSSGIVVKERSKILVLLYPANLRDVNRNIQAIREKYKSMFQQESVLRVDGYARVSF